MRPWPIAAALAEQGIPSLGIDVSPAALRSAHASGAIVLERSVFDPLPGEGRWGSVLLMDGNIGIGGNPVRLLARLRQLISSEGAALVEVEPPGLSLVQDVVRLKCRPRPTGPGSTGHGSAPTRSAPSPPRHSGAAPSVTTADGSSRSTVSDLHPEVTLAVIAKQPVAGKVKMRLCPPCTGTDAAAIATPRSPTRSMPSSRPMSAVGPWCSKATAAVDPGRLRGVPPAWRRAR